MAGLETIASIVGIAGIGIKLAKTLYQVGHKTANANHNINRIATNVSLFASMLKHVGSVLDDAHSLHSPDAVETVKQIVRECESTFKEIADIIVLARDKSEGSKDPPLANGSKRRINMVARAKWYFEGPKAEHLLAQLEYLKTTLSVLLQTLNLAALTAKVNATLGHSEKSPEIVQQERLHVETLIVAQQLSVHSLRETQEKLGAESTRPSTPSEDPSLESRYHKLLTQGSQTSLQMVRLGNADLEFLDRRPSLANSDGAPLEHSNSRPEAFIDDLLAKWTVGPEEKLLRPRENGTIEEEEEEEEEEELERQATPVPAATRSKPDAPEVTGNASSQPVPNVKIAPSTSPPAVAAVSPTTRPPSQQWTSPRSDIATLASRDVRSPRAPSSLDYAPSETSSSSPSVVTHPLRGTLERSITNPEGDGMPTLNAFHDHHSLQPSSSANRNANTSIPPPQLAQHQRAPAPYYANGLGPLMAGAAAASGNAHLSPGWGNYRQPYVSDEDSTWSPSDSDGSTPSPQERKSPVRPRRESTTSTASRHGRHTSQQGARRGDAGDGLGIPWRIRISSSKYFDFRDDMLVGPRTPYLPSEHRSWIFSQEHAYTELSKKWVCEEALVEMRYSHTELRDEHDAAAIAGEEGGWRILSPLKFHEIESLVNRTVQFVEQARAKKQNAPPASPQAQSRHAGPVVQMPQHPRIPNRSVSFNDGLPPIHPPATGPQVKALPWKASMSPRDAHDHASSPRERQGRNEWRDPYRERERDRSRERWLAQKEHGRERGRERPFNRAKPKRREKDRGREGMEKKKEKHRSGGMGSTLAKVGTLAMLLEGLEGAF